MSTKPESSTTTPVSKILGSAGFVGRCLARYLEKQGHEVVHHDIQYTRDQDLREKNIFFGGIDYIYFLAWDVGGSKYLYNKDTQQAQLLWNVQILQKVMPQLAEHTVPFLFVSSQHSGRRTAYGLTKQLGEYWTQLAGGFSVRLWNIYGEVEKVGERSHVVGDLITQALTTGEIRLMTHGFEMRNFIFEEDACRGLVMAMENRPENIFDIASREPVSILRVADIIAQMTGAVVTTGYQTGFFDGTLYRPDVLPGFEPEYKLEEGLSKTIQRYRESLINAES